MEKLSQCTQRLQDPYTTKNILSLLFYLRIPPSPNFLFFGAQNVEFSVQKVLLFYKVRNRSLLGMPSKIYLCDFELKYHKYEYLEKIEYSNTIRFQNLHLCIFEKDQFFAVASK